jgi:hypothetical protein
MNPTRLSWYSSVCGLIYEEKGEGKESERSIKRGKRREWRGEGGEQQT